MPRTGPVVQGSRGSDRDAVGVDNTVRRKGGGIKGWSRLLGLLSLLLWACSHNPQQVGVSERSTGKLNRSGHYLVQPGDTLSEIASRYGMDYRVLARYNGLPYPYVIRAGDKLSLQQRSSSVSGATRNQPASRRAADAASRSPSRAAHSSSTSAAWRWPASGGIGRRFSEVGTVHKGVDINGQLNQLVLAAKAGEVLYAGSGLKAYGLLVIIKHDERYLSAYAYNRKVFVREGDRVKRGQKIAQMGIRKDGKVGLHFEIRRDGRPIDPIKYLPQR